MKTTVPLSAALAVSIVLNVALLRRGPAEQAPPAARGAAAAAEPAPDAPAASPAPRIQDAGLSEELRSVRVRLAVVEASNEISRNGSLPAGPSNHPDAHDFIQLRELLDSLIDFVRVPAIDENGAPVIVQKPILTRDSREQGLTLLEDYAAFDPASRRSFRKGAWEAIEHLRRNQDRDAKEGLAASAESERLQKLGRPEEAQTVADREAQRSTQIHEAWLRDQIQPLRTMLEAQETVRAALLSRHLTDFLSTLGSLDER